VRLIVVFIDYLFLLLARGSPVNVRSRIFIMPNPVTEDEMAARQFFMGRITPLARFAGD